MSTKSAARTVNAMALSALLIMAHVMISDVSLFGFMVVALLSLWLFIEQHVIAAMEADSSDLPVSNGLEEDFQGFDNAMMELRAIESELYALQDQFSTGTWADRSGGKTEFLPKQ